MPRKRTSKGTTPPEIPTPVQPEPEPQPSAPVSTALQEPPAPEGPGQQPSFVERVQQQRGRNIASDPFGIAGDYEAGVRLLESRRYRQMVIKFEEKPSPEVLERVKSAGYRWSPNDKAWVQSIPRESARATRIEAERLYQEVRDMIRQDKGIDAGQEVPF
jgi:hypothetical protein